MQESHDREPALIASLRALADAETTAGASPAVKAQLLAEMRSQRRARRASLITMMALAAGLFLATAVPILQLGNRPALDGALTVVPAAAEATDAEIATAFYPLFYSNLPVSEGHIVRLEVPPAAFASFGVEPIAPAVGARSDIVLADVLIGEDGLARAVRFVRTLTRDQPQERQP